MRVIKYNRCGMRVICCNNNNNVERFFFCYLARILTWLAMRTKATAYVTRRRFAHPRLIHPHPPSAHALYYLTSAHQAPAARPPRRRPCGAGLGPILAVLLSRMQTSDEKDQGV
jgi:hypothetical protein